MGKPGKPRKIPQRDHNKQHTLRVVRGDREKAVIKRVAGGVKVERREIRPEVIEKLMKTGTPDEISGTTRKLFLNTGMENRKKNQKTPSSPGY